jgi:opacity protein-like surface antigen
MKKILLSISAISLLATSLFAGKNYEEPKSEPIPIVLPLGFYIGAGFTYSKAECKCGADNANILNIKPKPNKGTTTGFNLRLGYDFNRYLGIEGKYIYTPWKESKKTVKHYGIYLKPNMPLGKNLDIYGLLGYGKTECETKLETFKGFSWGIGAEYSFKKRVSYKREGFGLYVEYLKPVNKSGAIDIDVDMVNAGVIYHF